MVSDATTPAPPSMLAFSEHLSERARTAVRTWKWHIDDRRRVSRDELARLLAEKGVPEWPFIWPLESAFAGAEVRLEGNDLEVGIAENIGNFDREDLVDENGRIRFVPLGYWGIYTIFLDAHGKMYLFHVPDDLTLIDSSFESFLENQAMRASLATWGPRLFVAYLSSPLMAPALAKERAVPPVVEASNEFHRWWQDDLWTLHQPGDDGWSVVWARDLSGLVLALDTANRIEPRVEVKPRPSYDDEHVETLSRDQIAARAPAVEDLRARPGSRRFILLGEPSIYKGKPPSSGDVWVSGEGGELRIEVLERRDGELVNYWQLTPEGSHALLSSRYGRA
jgi:hypothetical protein